MKKIVYASSMVPTLDGLVNECALWLTGDVANRLLAANVDLVNLLNVISKFIDQEYIVVPLAWLHHTQIKGITLANETVSADEARRFLPYLAEISPVYKDVVVHDPSETYVRAMSSMRNAGIVEWADNPRWCPGLYSQDPACDHGWGGLFDILLLEPTARFVEMIDGTPLSGEPPAKAIRVWLDNTPRWILDRSTSLYTIYSVSSSICPPLSSDVQADIDYLLNRTEDVPDGTSLPWPYLDAVTMRALYEWAKNCPCAKFKLWTHHDEPIISVWPHPGPSVLQTLTSHGYNVSMVPSNEPELVLILEYINPQFYS